LIEIGRLVHIRAEELQFEYSRSAGPGGQNVNKLSTRVTLRFDLRGSPSLTDEQKRRVADRLRSRINRDGVLHVSAQRHRTQAANRAAAVARFVELLEQALTVPKHRRPTAVSAGQKRRRLADKTRRGEVKQRRSWRPRDEGHG